MKKQFVGFFLCLFSFATIIFSSGNAMAALVVNTNTASINALNKLNETNKKLSSVFVRISSGLHINKAADDAAGLGISESKDVDYQAIQKARLHVRDTISLIQTAEGATNEISNILKRMRELALQANSETLEDDEGSPINTEFQQLQDDLDRITLREPYIDVDKDTTQFQSPQALKSAARFLMRLQDLNDDIQDFDIVDPDTDTKVLVHEIDVSLKSFQSVFHDVVRAADTLSRSSEKTINNAERKIKKLKQHEERLIKSQPRERRY